MTTVDERLFRATELRGEAVTYCLPDAGSGASAFGRWHRRFPAGVEIRPLRLPGREERINEPPRLSPVEIADGISRHADRPYALYGHSVGARLAFEVVRELARRPGTRLPVALYVGGALPPDVRPPLLDAIDLPDDRLVTELINRAGAGPELRDVPELRELILPVIRADLGWLRAYRFQPGARLPIPLVGFAGLDDRCDGAGPMLGWARQAAAGFRLHTVPGDHGFHRSAPAQLIDVLAADLAARVRGERPAAAPPAGDEVHVYLVRPAAGTDPLSIMDQIRSRYGADPELRFSLGRNERLALVTVAWGHTAGAAIGPTAGDAVLAEDGLHPEERARLVGVSHRERLAATLRLLTAKRAVLAATGPHFEPGAISFAGQPGPVPDGEPAPPPWRATVPEDLAHLRRWRVTHLPLDGAIAAIAVERDRWRLRFEIVAEGGTA